MGNSMNQCQRIASLRRVTALGESADPAALDELVCLHALGLARCAGWRLRRRQVGRYCGGRQAVEALLPCFVMITRNAGSTRPRPWGHLGGGAGALPDLRDLFETRRRRTM